MEWRRIEKKNALVWSESLNIVYMQRNLYSYMPFILKLEFFFFLFFLHGKLMIYCCGISYIFSLMLCLSSFLVVTFLNLISSSSLTHNHWNSMTLLGWKSFFPPIEIKKISNYETITFQSKFNFAPSWSVVVDDYYYCVEDEKFPLIAAACAASYFVSNKDGCQMWNFLHLFFLLKNACLVKIGKLLL